MITPSYLLTAPERVLPRLALDFTTATLDPRVTFTRSGNTATVINSSGVIVAVNADIPRFDYNPTTLVCNGLLIEESRTNVLLNSLLDGTSLATQSVTVTAAARTLSFYGTGEVVLSGAHSATVTGTGAYPTRTTLTFTPSAGTLTLTVTGTVQFAQLELGSFATSFIPTAASQVTRNADVATMTGTDFSDWFNASEGTLQCLFDTAGTAAATTPRIWNLDSGSDANMIAVYLNGTSVTMYNRAASTTSVSSAIGTLTSSNNAVYAFKTNLFAGALGGANTVTDTTGTLASSINSFNIGMRRAGSDVMSGHVAKINYWSMRLTSAEVQAFSK